VEHTLAIAYADDIVLMAPTVEGLNRLLNICSVWSRENNISFNPSKSVVICFAERKNKWPVNEAIPAFLDGNMIPTKTEILHLGHILTYDLDDSPELIRIAKSFKKQFHAFFTRFNGIRDQQILINIFNSFCCSFYGLEGIFREDVSASAFRFFKKSYNLAVMKLLKLPRESVSPYLMAEGLLNADSTWQFRSLVFWKVLLNSLNPRNTFLIMSNSSKIFSLTNELNIMPLALAVTSADSLKNTTLLRWMAQKNMLA
jgi:hypothetical protein